MQMEIFISEWKIVLDNKNRKTIAGKYQVKMGDTVVSESQFNDGYNTADIIISSEILAKAECLDVEIKEAIIKNFTK